MNKLSLLTAVSFLALNLAACSHERTIIDKEPGTYEKYTNTTDANGTTSKKKTTTDVSVDRYGNKTAVVKSKSTKDPEGLFNKSTNESTEVYHER